MKSAMEEIFELHKIDQQLVALKKRLTAGPEEIALQESKVEAAREERRTAEDNIKSKASQVDQCNLDIRTCEGEVEDINEKLPGVKNNKEYKILTDSLKDAKRKIGEKETEAIDAMEELDSMREVLKEKQAAVTQEEEKLNALKQEIEGEAAKIREEGKGLKAQREQQVTKVNAADPEAMAEYSLSLKRGRGIAIAEMVGGICQVCFRQQRPNTENLVHVGRDLKECHCAGCGRLLYAAPRQESTTE